MKPFLFYTSLCFLIISCLDSNLSNTNNAPQDTTIIIKQTSLPNDIKFLSLVINGDTIDYPFEFTKDYISTRYLPHASMKMDEYLTKLNEILPYYLKEINTNNNFNLIFSNQVSSTFDYKFDREKLNNFLNEKNVNKTYTNGILNTSLSFSNFKSILEKILPKDYFVKEFSSEKVEFNISDLKKESKNSLLDSVSFTTEPFIGILWVKIEKH